MSPLSSIWRGDARSDRVVPPTGFTARLVVVAAGALCFIAVFALALSVASGRLAARWEGELANTATVRISAPAEQLGTQTEAALRVLRQTPGIVAAEPLGDDDFSALLEPWFGSALPAADLPLPALIEIREGGGGYDREGLRLRLQAEAPGAVLDDHSRWRRPLADAAERLRTLGLLSVVLIGAVVAVLITLAASSSLAANAQVIRVLRLVGATDRFIARAFVRRFTVRAFTGAAAGAAVGLLAVALLPPAQSEGAFLTDLGFRGAEWALPLALPFLVAGVAYLATRAAASRALRELR